MTKYMILDKDNMILNVLSFADNHNEDLQAILSVIPEGEEIIEINEEELFGVGLQYDSNSGKVIPNQPYPSWIWDEVEFRWNCPIEVPENVEGYRYVWNEDDLEWNLVSQETN
jgi:hypothetical protein